MRTPKYTDEERVALGKKNYEEFWNKMQELASDEEDDDGKLYASYVHLKSGDVVEDYYWSDHEITPTGLLKWFGTYNQNRNHHNVVLVSIHPDKYDKLITMYDNLYEPLEVNGIQVVRNDTI